MRLIRHEDPKYVLATDCLLQQRNGIRHVNRKDFMMNGGVF